MSWNDGGGSKWSNFVLGDNQNAPSNGKSMYTDYDDIAVSTTAIGPLNSTLPPLPSAPQSLRIIK